MSTLGVILCTVVAYELLRGFFLRRFSRHLEERALGYVKRNRVRLESARFIDRMWLRQALLQDHHVEAAIATASRERGVPLNRLMAQVEGWIHEMAPAFSLGAYYRIGGGVAKGAVEFLYELVFDRESYQRAMAAVPEGAIVVFVINHRSNADYVVLSYGLLRHMALSYAVGEWARVWPLDLLFRAFGSFFIRRGEGDRLYHTVLERFVQLLVAHGGTMGFFIEGGLSRDGKLRPPKAGLLDYIVGIRRDHPDREIAFVPVGINFDRVLEDRQLTGEGAAPPTPLQKVLSLLSLTVEVPAILAANFLRLATSSHRKLGYAAVTVGAPVRLTTWEGENPLATLPFEERRPRVKAFAGHLLDEIAKVIPVTPVPLFCWVLLHPPGPVGEPGSQEKRLVVERVQEALATLRAKGAPVALGKVFPKHEGESNIEGLDEAIAARTEAELLVTLAGYALERRKVVDFVEGRFVVREGRLVEYYSRSIEHHLS